MYIYRLISFSVDDDVDYNVQEYITSNKLYDKDEFHKLCNKCVKEVKEKYNEVCQYIMKQHMILHYGFKGLEPIQEFRFNEEYP